MLSWLPVEAKWRQQQRVEVLARVATFESCEERARSRRRRQSHLTPVVGQTARQVLCELVAVLEDHVLLETDTHAAVCVAVAADERRAHVEAGLAHEAVGVRERGFDERQEFAVDERVEGGTAALDDELQTPAQKRTAAADDTTFKADDLLHPRLQRLPAGCVVKDVFGAVRSFQLKLIEHMNLYAEF